jgi:hypothetical protein
VFDSIALGSKSHWRIRVNLFVIRAEFNRTSKSSTPSTAARLTAWSNICRGLICRGTDLSRLGLLAPEVAGQWQAEFETQIGPQMYRFDFRVEDGKVTAKAVAEAGDLTREVEFEEAIREGVKLTFVELRPMGE